MGTMRTVSSPLALPYKEEVGVRVPLRPPCLRGRRSSRWERVGRDHWLGVDAPYRAIGVRSTPAGLLRHDTRQQDVVCRDTEPGEHGLAPIAPTPHGSRRGALSTRPVHGRSVIDAKYDDRRVVIVDLVDDAIGAASCRVRPVSSRRNSLPTRRGSSSSGPSMNSTIAVATFGGRRSSCRAAGPATRARSVAIASRHRAGTSLAGPRRSRSHRPRRRFSRPGAELAHRVRRVDRVFLPTTPTRRD
jgi:hypothetical protein